MISNTLNAPTLMLSSVGPIVSLILTDGAFFFHPLSLIGFICGMQQAL